MRIAGLSGGERCAPAYAANQKQMIKAVHHPGRHGQRENWPVLTQDITRSTEAVEFHLWR
jgi:hypothetical protein